MLILFNSQNNPVFVFTLFFAYLLSFNAHFYIIDKTNKHIFIYEQKETGILYGSKYIYLFEK